MGLLSNLGARAFASGPSTPRTAFGHYEIDVTDFGQARCVVDVGDLDGSGEAPGIQLELEHVGGHLATAFSARESELLARALLMSAAEVEPHERLKQRVAKWRQSLHPVAEPVQQRFERPPTETVELTHDEIRAILKTKSPGLKSLREKLELPY